MISNIKKRLGEINQIAPENNNVPTEVGETEIGVNNNNEESLNNFSINKDGALNRLLSGNSRGVNVNVNEKLIKSENAEKSNDVGLKIDRTKKDIAASSEHPAKNRNSFHQDLNEALNSLLWQPYEYQNKHMSDDSSSASSFSSCCSLSSIDLERSCNNRLVQSPRCGNEADLHLTIEMVNNLTCCGNRLNQYTEGKAARDALATSSPTRLLSNVSACELRDEVLTCSRCGNNCNEFALTPGSMRVEICNSLTDASRFNKSNKENNPKSVSSVNLTHQNVSATGGDLPGGATQQRHSHVTLSTTTDHAIGYKRCVSSDMIPSNLNSIVSANVVGLPNHPRHASVPSSTTQNRNSTGNSFMFPNHPRNASEPSAMIQQPVVVNHSRNGSTPSASASNNPIRNVSTPRSSNVTVNQNSNISCANIVSILSHHRHSSHVNNTEIPLLGGNTIRSASVPKSIENNTLNISTGRSADTPNRIPINVSAVDVNFYRAVPVNVVSNVPTIHCVNNSSEIGNNVSNVNIVQAMPTPVTHSTIQQPRNFTHRVQNGIIGVTQVTVHNSEVQETPPASVQRVQEETRTRTFTSTEAQTDDATTTLTIRPTERAVTREQRRRERRERRHLRRVNNANHQHNGATRSNNNGRLPDLLNNHLPPPYSPNHGNLNSVNIRTPVSNGPARNSLMPGTVVSNNVVPSAVVTSHVVPFHPPVGQVPLVQGGGPVGVPVPAPSGFRFPFPTAGFRRYAECPPLHTCIAYNSSSSIAQASSKRRQTDSPVPPIEQRRKPPLLHYN
ncbi:hypothetical protein FQA39_LY17082 [Lamprigera yunnana]|nr:hypothetical protein FQA39_LY17082 [Lamprigera yunnana]